MAASMALRDCLAEMGSSMGRGRTFLAESCKWLVKAGTQIHRFGRHGTLGRAYCLRRLGFRTCLGLQRRPVDLLSVIYIPQEDGFHVGPFDSGHTDIKADLLPAPELDHVTGDSAAEFSCFQYLPAVGPTNDQ